jgi:hypothetical protein
MQFKQRFAVPIRNARASKTMLKKSFSRTAANIFCMQSLWLSMRLNRFQNAAEIDAFAPPPPNETRLG